MTGTVFLLMADFLTSKYQDNIENAYKKNLPVETIESYKRTKVRELKQYEDIGKYLSFSCGPFVLIYLPFLFKEIK
jgi:hypothetical protein